MHENVETNNKMRVAVLLGHDFVLLKVLLCMHEMADDLISTFVCI